MAGDPQVQPSPIQRMAAWEHGFCRNAGVLVSSAAVVALMRASSRVGDWPLSVVVGLLLAVTHGPEAFVAYTLASVCGVGLQKQLKVRCARMRPCEHPDGPPQRAPIPDVGSFPSGHTLHATMAAVVVAQLLPVLAMGFATVAILIGLSRVVLGVHYPSDVLAGATLGAVFASVLVGLL